MSQDGWQCFLKLCLSAKDEDVLSELLELILTPEEHESIKTRCLIIKALMEHKQTQRQISDDLKVSIAKITRGSNELKRISPEMIAYLEKYLLH